MATYTSVQDGNWDAVATWGGGGYPSIAGDVAYIGHNVIYNVNSATQMGHIYITAGGQLSFSKTMNTRLAQQAGKWIYVSEGGGNCSVVIGEDEDNVLPKEYTAIIEWTTSSDNTGGFYYKTTAGGEYRYVKMFGDPELYGDVISTELVSDWSSGKTFTVSGNLVGKWKPGQNLVLEDNYMSQGTAPVTERIKSLTIDTVVLNVDGVNTDITVLEAYSQRFYTGGIVANLTRNIILRKVSPTLTPGSYNTNRPGINGNYAYSSIGSIFSNVDLSGLFYAVGIRSFEFNRCVFRNGGSALYSSENSTVYDPSDASFATALSQINECIFFSMSSAISTSYNLIFNNCLYIGNVIAMENCVANIFNDCKFIANNAGLYNSRSSSFYGCDFVDNYKCMHYCYGDELYFEDCSFWGSWYVAYQATRAHFNFCYIGVKRTGEFNDIESGWDSLYAWNGGARIIVENSIINFPPIPFPLYSDGRYFMENVTTLGLTSSKSYYQNNLTSPMHLLTPPNNFGSLSGVAQSKSAEVYVGDCSKRIFSIFGDVAKNNVAGFYEERPIALMDVTEQNVAKGVYTRKIYVKTDITLHFLPKTELYLEAEYFGDANSYVKSRVQSVQVISSNNAWTCFSVTFETAKTGDVKYRFILKNMIDGYTWDPVTYEDYFSSLWIDSAIWVSDVNFVKLNWGIGEFQESFITPQFPNPDAPRPGVVVDGTGVSREINTGAGLAVYTPTWAGVPPYSGGENAK